MKPYQSKTKMDELQQRARNLAKLHTYAIHAEAEKRGLIPPLQEVKDMV